jgi:predicted nucleic acid-binding protein
VIVLDTNVLSSIARPVADQTALQWFNRQARHSIWSTSVTLFEIQLGLCLLPPGRRRASYEQAFRATLEEDLEDRILKFDGIAAHAAAAVAARRRRAGIAVEIRDTQIAGIAMAHRATIATRNTRHFEDLDVPVINPWN